MINTPASLASPGEEQETKGLLDPDAKQRKHYLDCAVIKRLHSLAAGSKDIGAIQSVKGVFVGEGGPAYPGSEFHAKTHIQIAVCDPTCIKAVFRVREMRQVT